MQEGDKNYAPPKAPVADVEQLLPPAPREVREAIFLLYGLMVVVGAGILASDIGPARYPALSGVAIVWAVAYFIGKGSRIARAVLVAFTLASFMSVLLSVNRHVSQTTVPSLLAWAGLMLRVIASCLVFTKPANAWFKRKII